MSITWPQSLITTIARRRAVILIGSGVSANAENAFGRRPPTWGAFLTDAFRQLRRRPAHIRNALRRFDYLEACDYLKIEHGTEWQDLVRNAFSTPQYRPAPIHKAIFDLDVRIVASLNFDKIFEIYAATASEGTIIVKNYYDPDIRQVVAGGERYILKPHGTIDSIDRMIFTLEDYARARNHYSAFYNVFTALLHTHTFLCIGCGLTDPDMQLVFEDYRYEIGECPHYLTYPTPIAQAQKDLIRKTRGINLIEYSKRNNHSELTSSLSELGKKVALKRNEIAEAQDW